MTATDLLEILKDFQTTLVGIVGFLGVILTLRQSAKHARADHERQVSTRRAALRRILSAELRNYRRAIQGNLEAQRPSGDFISMGRINRLFSEQLSKDLGLLEPDEIDVVVNALISLDGMAQFLESISSERTENRFVISARSWDELRWINSTTEEALKYAIETLDLFENSQDSLVQKTKK